MPTFVALIAINLLAVSCLSQQIPARQLVLSASQAALPNAPEVAPSSERKPLFSTPLRLADLSRATAPLRAREDPTVELDGVRAKVSMVTEISSKLPNNSTFRARLNEGLSRDGRVLLPQGTLLEGHLVTKHARRIMRSGSMLLSFDHLILPDGAAPAVSAYVVAADSTSLRTDHEGMLHPRLSKKRLLIEAGGTAMAAKFADDLAQLAGGAAVGAGSARLVGMGAAGMFLALQKGREAKLHAGDEIEVEFGRLEAIPLKQ